MQDIAASCRTPARSLWTVASPSDNSSSENIHPAIHHRHPYMVRQPWSSGVSLPPGQFHSLVVGSGCALEGVGRSLSGLSLACRGWIGVGVELGCWRIAAGLGRDWLALGGLRKRAVPGSGIPGWGPAVCGRLVSRCFKAPSLPLEVAGCGGARSKLAVRMIARGGR